MSLGLKYTSGVDDDERLLHGVGSTGRPEDHYENAGVEPQWGDADDWSETSI